MGFLCEYGHTEALKLHLNFFFRSTAMCITLDSEFMRYLGILVQLYVGTVTLCNIKGFYQWQVQIGQKKKKKDSSIILDTKMF